MFAMAIVWTCFGIGDVDFFRSMDKIYEPFSKISTFASNVIDTIFAEPDFAEDAKIIVDRFFFENKTQYVDVISTRSPFSKKIIGYSTNPSVTKYRNNLIGSTIQQSFSMDFTNALGGVIYRWRPWNGRYYTLYTTYGEYYRDYRLEPSVEDGWI